MDESKADGTPMVTRIKLSKEDTTGEVDQTLYKSMIGKLQYVVHSRPNISLDVGIIARFQSNPRGIHMNVMKIIFKYLKGTDDYVLQYKQEDDFNLKVYIDVDWDENIDDGISTSGTTFFLGERLITWINKKQSCISQSIVEAEYVVAINCSNIVSIEQLLEGMQEEVIELVTICCDNTSAINISEKLVMHEKTKHISIKYHYLREKVQEKKVRIEYVKSKEPIVDIFTNPLPKDVFKYLRGKMGVLSLSKIH